MQSEDTALVGQCLGGKPEAYGRLVEKYSARIINLAYAMMSDRHEAEDVAQEAFVRAYKGLPRFQRKAKFSSWLYQIALNLCKDHLKAKSRHAKSADEDQLNGVDGNPRDEAATMVVEGELSQKMRERIQELPVLYRESFVLRHLQGLDYADIAKITEVPADTVRVRAYRAREMLRQTLAKNVDTFWREKALKEKGTRDKE
ncbi:MAG TPA: RNA polymerase sigma factor [Planctomycetota bacterium]